MTDVYGLLKVVHVSSAFGSGALFAARGAGVLAMQRWPGIAAVRYASYLVDSVLLAAAVAMVIVLPAPLFENGWLTVKVCLVGAYIALGSYAIRRGRTRTARAFFLVAALLVYASIVAVAWTHDPLGPFRLLAR